MSEVADIIRAGSVAIAQEGAMRAGLPFFAVEALEAMKANHRYRLDQFPHPDGAVQLINRGLAIDISSQYAGSIRGVTLNTAGEILRGAIFGCQDKTKS